MFIVSFKKKNKIIKFFIVIIFSLIILVIIFNFFNNKTVEISRQIVNKDLSLKIKHVESSTYNSYVYAVGILEPLSTIDLLARSSGEIKKIFFQKGFCFDDVDSLIMEIESDRQVLDFVRAQSLWEHQRLVYDAKKKLADDGKEPALSLRAAEVSLRAAEVDFKAAELAMENTKVVSSFAGCVHDINVKQGDLVVAGQGLATIIRNDKILAKVFVPGRDLIFLRVGGKAIISLENGEKINSYVKFISSVSQSDTRLYLVEIESNELRGFRGFGQYANILIAKESINAYNIPMSALTTDENGKIGVKVLRDEMVKFICVELLEDSPDGVWVKLLGDDVTEIKLILMGHCGVEDGCVVNDFES